MKSLRKLAYMLAAVALIGSTALMLNQKVSAAGEGKISGTVKLDGTPPHMKGIDMSKDPYCVKVNANNTPKMENVVVNSSGGLENVVLYISEGLSGDALNKPATAVPVFDQKNCEYTPHVLAMNPGETFKVTTSDQTAHNIHPNPNPMTGNIPWNQSQPPGAPPVEKSWKAPEMIEVKCNIHPWMHGWFAVVKGPYATTDENGNYTINNVPPGNYTVTAWQEQLGTQTTKVTVASGGTGKADFTFKAK
jgi:plastocyanin